MVIAAELIAWTQLLAFTGHHARRWEPTRVRHRIFTIPATLARTHRQVVLHLNQNAPWADLLTQAAHRLRLLAAPG